MWPFSTIQKLREEIRCLESQIREKDNVISSLQGEQKTAEEKLVVAEKNAALLKESLDFMKDVEVTPEFLEVERSIRNRDPLIFVHGGAGTGKSTLIQWLRKKELIHVVLAPTGLTALNVGGMTVHRAFGLAPLKVFTKNGIPNNIPQNFKAVLNNLKAQHIETICIDEISMVRSDLLDALNQCLEEEFQKKPFGGFQMLFVGDLFQLPPVVPAGVVHFFDPQDKNYPGDLHGWHSPWFLDSDVLSHYKSMLKKIELTKVFRQAGEMNFVKTLNNLRKYRQINVNAAELNAIISLKQTADKNSVIIVGTNQQADTENTKRLNEIKTTSRQYIAMKTGTFLNYNQKNLPVPDDITLKNGEFIIIVANDIGKRYYNGSTATITRFGPNGEVYVKDKNGEFVVHKNAWLDYDITWDAHLKRFVNKEVGRYTQMPIIPGYAITCHKSQGKTIPSVFIDVQKAFAPGQMYVALSRTRSPKDISMKRPLTDADFPCDPRLSGLIQQGFF